ncbi:MAG: choice-of-anchor D domain-containing protein [Halorhabdus sp.]
MVIGGTSIPYAVPAVGTAAAAGNVKSISQVPKDQVFEATNDGQIQAWERAMLPLRTDDTGAATEVPFPNVVRLEELGGGSFTSGDDGKNSKSMVRDFGTERNPAGIHTADKSIYLEFNDNYANENLADQQRVEIVTGRLTGSDKGAPDDPIEAIKMLGNEEQANENASWEVTEGKSLDGNGVWSDTGTPSKPGEYLVYAVVRESGKKGFETGDSSNLNIPNDNISVSGTVTVIGVEQVSVQQGPASVTKPANRYAGANMTFDIDTTNSFSSSKDGKMTHIVAVYDSSKYNKSVNEMVVDEDKLGPNFALSDDVQFETTIGDVNGEARIQDGITVSGVDITDGEVAKTVGVEAVIDQLATTLDADKPDINSFDGGDADSSTETLDASITAVTDKTRQESVSVETFSNFTTGTYRYVVISKPANNASAIVTSSGQISMSQALADLSLSGVSGKSLSYGDVNVASSSTKQFTIKNDGNEVLKLNSLSLSGTNADQFSITQGGSAGSLDPGESRTVKVKFAPTQRASASATLTIESNDPDQGTIDISLSGTGIGPSLNVPTGEPVTFPSDGATNQVKIENVGDSGTTLTGSVSESSSAFDITSGGGSFSIDAGNTHTVDLKFNPSSAGEYNALLEITSLNDPANSSRTVGLTGTKEKKTIALSKSNSLEFGRVSTDDSTTVTRSIVVTNTGTVKTDVTPSLGSTTHYSVGSGVTGLKPGKSAVIDVTFEPDSTQTSALTTTLTLDYHSGKSKSLSLSGRGRDPKLSVSSPSTPVDFGDVPNGDVKRNTITVKNSGEAVTKVSSLSITGTDSSYYSIVEPTSSFTIPTNGSTKDITVKFSPTSGSQQTLNSAKLELDTNATNVGSGTLTVGLDGKEVTSNVDVGTGSADFGKIGIEGSATKQITVTNNGGAQISSLSASISGSSQYSISEGISSSLDAGASDTVTVKLTPDSGQSATEQTYTGTLEITNKNTGTTKATTSLTGVGVAQDISLGTSTLDYGVIEKGKTKQLTLDVSNVQSDTTLSISSVSIDGDPNADPSDNAAAFSIDSKPTSVSGGSTGTVAVTFDTSTTGSGFQRATLSIDSDDPGEPTRNVTLRGYEASPESSVGAGVVSFGAVSFDTSTQRDVTITNTGGVALKLSDLTISADTSDLSLATDPTANGAVTLVPGASTTATIKLAPTTTDSLSANLELHTNESASSVDTTVGLSATIDKPELTVKDSGGNTLSSGNKVDISGTDTPLGSSSKTTITITNDATSGTLRVNPSSFSDSQFSLVSGDETTTLSPGASTSLTVAYAPADTTTSTGTLDISTNDPDDGEQTISLDFEGTGTSAQARVSPATASLGGVDIGGSQSQTLQLKNTGGSSTTVNVDSVSITGPDASAFSVSGISDSTSVDGGNADSFTVTASPSQRGPLTATLEIQVSGFSISTTTLKTSLGATGKAPDINVVESSVSFGDTRLGGSTQKKVTIENTGNQKLKIDSLSVSGTDSGQFAALTSAPIEVGAGEQKTVGVEFTPPETETAVSDANNSVQQSATLTISTSNDPDESSKSTTLSGTGVTPIFDESESSLKFGTVSLGSTASRTVTLENKLTGTTDIKIKDVAVNGHPAFSLKNSFSSATLSPGDSTDITVNYSPKRRGSKFATLHVKTNDPRKPTKVIFLSNTDTTVEVSYGSVKMNYTNPLDGAQPQINISRNTDRAAGFKTFQIAESASGAPANFGATLEVSDKAFNSNPVQRNDIKSLNYVRGVNDLDDNNNFKNATITFRVSKSALSRVGTPKDALALYHYDSSKSKYVKLSTTLLRETPKNYVYSATTTSFSDFSVGAGQAVLNVRKNPSLSSTSVTKGNSVSVTAIVENNGPVEGTKQVSLKVDGSTKQTKSVTVSGSSTTTPTKTVQFTYTFSSTGSKSIKVNSRSAGTVSVTSGGGGDDEEEQVTPTPTPTPSAGAGTGGTGGGLPPITKTDDTVIVKPEATKVDTGELVNATVNSVEADTTISIKTNVSVTTGAANATDAEPKASVQSLNISVREQAQDVAVSVQSSSKPPENTPKLDKGASFGYIEVEKQNLNDENVSQASFKFTVSEQKREQLGVRPDQVVLYRYHDGAWRKLATSHVSNDTYRAITPGFSAFAIGTEGVNVSLTSARLETTSVTVNDQVRTSVQFRNSGTNATEFTVPLALDGDTVTETTVSIGANDTASVTLTTTVSSPGTYTVSVNGTAIGTLQVTDVTTETSTDVTTTEAPTGVTTTEPPAPTTTQRRTTEESTGIFGPGFGAPVAIIAIFALVVLLYRRRER